MDKRRSNHEALEAALILAAQFSPALTTKLRLLLSMRTDETLRDLRAVAVRLAVDEVKHCTAPAKKPPGGG